MRVSKETAVLLKDAGYDVPTHGYYIGGDGVCWASKSPDNHNSNHMTYSAPTLHEAADWLRSNGVHIWTTVRIGEWAHVIERCPEGTVLEIHYSKSPTHDSAYEAGIVHGLKYIKNPATE